jgi:hypothetical protein
MYGEYRYLCLYYVENLALQKKLNTGGYIVYRNFCSPNEGFSELKKAEIGNLAIFVCEEDAKEYCDYKNLKVQNARR